MKATTLALILLILCTLPCGAQKNLTFSPLIQQCGMYYTSDRITADGVGLGLGLHLLHRTGLAAQADVNLLWLNGNSIPIRLALGYQRSGRWTPAAYLTADAIVGQRTQFLSETGAKPPVPAWSFGVRITPLKFRTAKGFLSALELGVGIGPARLLNLEVTLFSAGISF
ncbi:MAG TPA: hypothetical protein PKN12_05650 [Bacteroidales bacterium]|jgi:hypothetical protein|nr:hypothetical protein [Bacteroidales bacterium]